MLTRESSKTNSFRSPGLLESLVDKFSCLNNGVYVYGVSDHRTVAHAQDIRKLSQGVFRQLLQICVVELRANRSVKLLEEVRVLRERQPRVIQTLLFAYLG